MNRNLKIGEKGEHLAVELLRSKGHHILHINYRLGHKEVDIISLDKDILVFTEVKTRSSFDFGYPETAVNEKKQQHLKSAAAQFLENNEQYQQLRFDVVSVLLQGNITTEILHIEDAFY